ncbi:N-acyl-D-amino-acid deacylase family protein [Shivajiella indica]|uniref:Amidohydrolase family protein n=1 Tax=Shivajiella indica TaxID=872115 RepID=A0ABW5BA75_9BACT
MPISIASYGNFINYLFWFKISVVIVFFVSCKDKSPEIDYLITNAMVYSGELVDPSLLDIGISGEYIVFFGDSKSTGINAKNIIDASGLFLCPGFIDPHTHLDRDLSGPDYKSNLSSLRQGVTTVFAGNDGNSPLPIARKLEEWERNGIGTNAGLFVGHGAIRRMVLGLGAKQPNVEELEEMMNLVAKSMEEGAFGLSTGLFYAPGSYAKEEEVEVLAKVAASYGGIYDSHIRDESSYSIGLISSIQEAINIGRKTGIPVHISHIKALGTDVWGKSKEVIELIESAQKEGIDVTANQYPYLASKTSFRATVIPRWAEDGGNDAMLERFKNNEVKSRLLNEIKENIRKRGGAEALVFSEAENKLYDGISLKKFAELRKLPEAEAAISILAEEPNLGVISYNMIEEDLKNFMLKDWVVTGSDGGSGHPRKYGSFARKIGNYALKEKLISLPFAVHQSTAKTADLLGLEKRGLIKEGYYADIVIFDPKKYIDKATFESPYEEAEGVEYVFVNGAMAIDKGHYKGILAGKALRINDFE